MLEITDDTIFALTNPNFFIKLFAYFLLPLGILLLGVIVWSLVKGQSLNVQIVLTCITCLLFGGYAATVLKTRGYKFDKRAKNVVVSWGTDVQTVQFDDVKSLEATITRNWVSIGMTSKDGGYSQIYTFPNNESSRAEGKKLMNALSETLHLEPQLDADAKKWFE